MTTYEPLQRLDFACEKIDKEYTVYLQSTVSVYLPAKTTLRSEEPIFDRTKWTCNYLSIPQDSASLASTFEHVRKLANLGTVPAPPETDPVAVIKGLGLEIAKIVGKTTFTVICQVFAKGPDGTYKKEGQVTNTINSSGQIVLL